ncbi:hypothetical protein BDV25DRAFT_159190 [Aspergillus avenaceus]|uniref:Ion transport domain-containing protein n=1 Tax=Aspergillus avenaceus TaxID=36643 RepID=A0A5N6TNN9_ASPAV|nr:hypothetical protein BDV25DRAFT_159190 [Aspergillus avenaceus]
MLSSVIRPRRRRVYAENVPFTSPLTTHESAWSPPPHRDSEPQYEELPGDDGDASAEDGSEDEDGPNESTPLLPIFAASQLDLLPVYQVTHSIRALIISRCETILTWDQLRSPQISQFMVKPIQQEIKDCLLSRATLYALLANCLQFNKEVQLNPGNSGTCQTRAMVSELLAMKFLREYTTRELIDALSYEFIPLQGQPVPGNSQLVPTGTSGARGTQLAGVARISCLEVAIRAQAKRFISHPVVVQQLEAIWAGTIVFHSASDYLHRPPAPTAQNGPPNYGTSGTNSTMTMFSRQKSRPTELRRSVTIYDPRDASLFKLSRLRVPRYRHTLSTLSFAVLLALCVAVLKQRSVEISALEVVFWLWSAGFMLDEIVGFNEQGFSLYLMSFWNVFDLGILVLLFCYYCLRLYGAFLPSTGKEEVANWAYDVLAANAVLLFPRLFSAMDHYRYFSQLLIAFRIMASDLVALFVLIIIACSGFFVALSLAFGSSENRSFPSTAFALFQMLMGFTPTAWTRWTDYNFLGRVILTVFLFICHFVVVTILVTVLTNSFMAIVQNANQEHQFLFAVNTISMVKSDALFSYVAPTNLLAWIITPLRYMMAIRKFVWINRTIIKITHLPILFSIWIYEKTVLRSRVVEPTDLIDSPMREGQLSPARPTRHSRFKPFSSGSPRLAREPSVATHQKDRALEEVFRPPLRDLTREMRSEVGKRKNNRVVRKWIEHMATNPPDMKLPEETTRLDKMFREQRYYTPRMPTFARSVRSAISNPEGEVNYNATAHVHPRDGRDSMASTRKRQLSRHTGMEGDDELTSDSHEGAESNGESSDDGSEGTERMVRAPVKFYSSRPSTARIKSRKTSPTRRAKHHTRSNSGATILYRPVSTQPTSNGEETDAASAPVRPRAETPGGIGRVTRSISVGRSAVKGSMDSRVRDTALHGHPLSMPDHSDFMVPSQRYGDREPQAILRGLGSDLGDNRAIANGFIGGVPSSLTTQMAYATGGMHRPDSSHDSSERLSKLVLARMNNIEESFREIIQEIRDLRREDASRSSNANGLSEIREIHRGRKARHDREGKKSHPGSGNSDRNSSDTVSDLSQVHYTYIVEQ